MHTPFTRRLPRLTTPQQASFDKFRERQMKRKGVPPTDMANDLADMAKEQPKGTPLGLDPVEGEPIDLREFVQGDGEFGPPTAAQREEAEADARAMLRGKEPDGFGDGIDNLFLGDADA